MKRIAIERNKHADELGCAGLIEGETDDGRHWVLFLDAGGGPIVFWPERREDGAVLGEGIPLPRVAQALRDSDGHAVASTVPTAGVEPA